ncbi:MAG: polyprenyl synthetase family protein [Actinomycetota bacterium]|nr:polyprenyl synthetase family protein [Actinomycetota bacterium]
MIPTQRVPEVLTRARELVAPALRGAIERLSPELRPLAAYHLGWVDAKGVPSGGDGGKGVRQALAVLSAEAVGAAGSVGTPGAVAVELVHNFSLIHDDVIDEDSERRHRPTVWALFGIGRAVIVGDALLALAQQVVLDPEALDGEGTPAKARDGGARAARCIADATAAMIAGQALDMAFESVPGVDVAGCLAMEAGKTGALLGCAASIGAVLAGAPDSTAQALDTYGVELGLAFQAVDDLLGIWGDPVATGKPAWSDLRQRKKTLPVAAALAAGGPGSEELAEMLAAAQLDEPQIARAAQLVEQCGGRSAAREEAGRRLDSALAALERSDLVPSAAVELADVARFVVERDY